MLVPGPKMAEISERYSDKIIVTTDNPRNESIDAIMSDILDGFKYNKHKVIEDRELAIIESIKMIWWGVYFFHFMD